MQYLAPGALESVTSLLRDIFGPGPKTRGNHSHEESKLLLPGDEDALEKIEFDI